MTQTVAAKPDLPGVAPSGRHANATLLVLFLSLGGLAFATLQSLVAPALPVIAKDLSASTGDISWVLTAYLLAASVFTPILGRLGDMVGKRRVLLAVLVIFFAGTLLAALAPNLVVLIAARALQGGAGAILLDTREPADFAAGHLRGAVNVGLQGRFAEHEVGTLTVPGALSIKKPEMEVNVGGNDGEAIWGAVHPPGYAGPEGHAARIAPAAPGAANQANQQPVEQEVRNAAEMPQPRSPVLIGLLALAAVVVLVGAGLLVRRRVRG